MKKLIFYFFAIFIIATACEKNEQAKKTDNTDKKSTEAIIDTTATTPDETPTYNYITLKELPSYECTDEKSIIGTWKCVGFGNSETKEIDLIEPANCEKCYTITFKKDATFGVKSVLNIFYGEYKVNNGNLEITNFGGTKVGEEGDALVFTESFSKISQCKIINNQLYLYYSTTK